MDEIELTFLVKYIPEGLFECPSKKIIDRYLPAESEHPVMRLRKSGEKMELTKKEPKNRNDWSHYNEINIPLNLEEYEALAKLPAKVVAKTRYYYSWQGKSVEIDVFEEDLSGLILADVEFESAADKEKFSMPEFCLADVTQEKVVAGGMLAGKKFSDIKEELSTYGYSVISPKIVY